MTDALRRGEASEARVSIREQVVRPAELEYLSTVQEQDLSKRRA